MDGVWKKSVSKQKVQLHKLDEQKTSEEADNKYVCVGLHVFTRTHTHTPIHKQKEIRRKAIDPGRDDPGQCVCVCVCVCGCFGNVVRRNKVQLSLKKIFVLAA